MESEAMFTQLRTQNFKAAAWARTSNVECVTTVRLILTSLELELQKEYMHKLAPSRQPGSGIAVSCAYG
jgi:hypothetical protein